MKKNTGMLPWRWCKPSRLSPPASGTFQNSSRRPVWPSDLNPNHRGTTSSFRPSTWWPIPFSGTWVDEERNGTKINARRPTQLNENGKQKIVRSEWPVTKLDALVDHRQPENKNNKKEVSINLDIHKAPIVLSLAPLDASFIDEQSPWYGRK